MHIATSENSTRGLCQAVRHVRLCASRKDDNEGSVNLIPEMPQKNKGLFLRHCLCYLQQYFSHLAVDSEKLGYVLEMTASEHIEKLRDGLNYRQSLRRTYGLRRQSLRRVGLTRKESTEIGTKFKLSARAMDNVLKSATGLSLSRIKAGHYQRV